MPKTFDEAKRDIDSTYKSLSKVADDIVNKYTDEIDKTIKKLENNVENITNDELRTNILKLSCLAYKLGDLAEHANLKSDCATALTKETNAREFNLAAGTVATKQNVAMINSSQEQAVNMLYSAVYDLFKTKLNSVHRVVDSLKNILISRNAEAKMQNIGRLPTVEQEQF